MNVIRFLLSLAAFFFAISANAQTVVQADLPQRHVGDRWEYSYHDTRRSERPTSTFSVEVTEVTPQGGFSIVLDRKTTVFEKVASITTNSHILDFSEINKVGKLAYKRATDENGWHRDFDITREVFAPEKVTVPAGTFDAFKVVFTYSYVGTNFMSSFSGSVVDTWWYAPAVGNYIKRTFSDDGDRAGSGLVVRELVKYQIK